MCNEAKTFSNMKNEAKTARDSQRWKTNVRYYPNKLTFCDNTTDSKKASQDHALATIKASYYRQR